MSKLTNALNRIIKYLEQNNPEAASWLQPGLSEQEITEIVTDLPFELPQELYELYQWRNGREITKDNYEQGFKYGFIFYADVSYRLCSIKEVVNNYKKAQKYNLNENSLGIFDFFSESTGYSYKDSKRIIFENSSDRENGGNSYQYTNLTNMMLTIAEGYETEVYGKHHYINDLQNYVLASTKIWWKYNSGIGDLLLNTLQNNWGYLGGLQYDIIAFKEYRVVPILIEILQAPASKLPDPSIYQYDRILRRIAIETLGYLQDIRAVEPIIKILQDTNQDEYTRYQAMEALGQLKSEKAVQPLIEFSRF